MKSENILNELLFNLEKQIIPKWYPLCVDKIYGGYYSNLSYDFEIMPEQDKMIVSQARHIWACSKFASFFEKDILKDFANHGFIFLRDKMWDDKYGGFFAMRSQEGSDSE